MAWPIEYSVVIIHQNGGITSRSAGTDLEWAKSVALNRRKDFLDAREIRVVSPETGVIAIY